MELRFLKEDDHDFVMSLEHRVTEESFRQRIAARNSFVLWEQGSAWACSPILSCGSGFRS